MRSIFAFKFRGYWSSVALAAALAFSALSPAQSAGWRQIRQWEQNLKSDDAEKRAAAATSLLSAGDSRSLDVLLKALKAEPEAVRITVIKTFGFAVDDRAMAPLIEALADESEPVRTAAAGALASITTPQAVQKLIDAAKDTRAPAAVRRSTIDILAEMREIEAIPHMIDLLADEQEDIRKASLNTLQRITFQPYASKADWDGWWAQNAGLPRVKILEELIARQGEQLKRLREMNKRLYIDLLSRRPDPKDAAPLIAAYKESADSAEIRLYAVEQLSRMKGPEVAAALVTALQDRESSVRARAAEGLGAQEGEVPQALLATVRDSSADVRLNVVKALGARKARPAVNALGETLKDPDARVAIAAATALGELADPAALEYLTPFIGDAQATGELYVAAAQAVTRIQDEKATPAQIKLLASAKESVRYLAVEALGNMKARDAVAPLTEVALKDGQPQIREAALAALGRIGAPEGLDAVTGALADNNERVRDAAMRALVALGGGNTALFGVALDRLVTGRQFDHAEKVLAGTAAQLTATNKQEEIKPLRHRLAKGLLQAQEWPRARKHYEMLVADPRYIPELATCLNQEKDYEALLKLMAQARQVQPGRAADWWVETVKAVEHIAATGAPGKVVSIIDGLSKETPELGGSKTAARLKELRSEAQKKLAVAPPA